MKPPMPYYGGKQRIAPEIVRLFPGHQHYVEPYAGGLSVLLAKAPSKLETVNDLDGELVNFWRVLRDQPDELVRVANLTPHSRAEMELARDRPAELSDVERARRVWVCLTQSRAGTLLRTGWRFNVDPSGTSIGVADYLRGYVDRMLPAADRLRSVSLECRDAVDVIRDFGQHPDVLLYVDPPYLGTTRTGRGYQVEAADRKHHEELAEVLAGAVASVALSGYASELYRDLYAGWNVAEIAASSGQGTVWRETTEVLWMNYDPPAQGELW